MDIAASIQTVLEEVVLRLTRALAAETRAENLCLAGGVALNCVANGRILRDGRFKAIWTQPAAGDAGGAIGAALAAHHLELGQPRRIGTARDGMSGGYLGPAFAPAEIARRLERTGARFERLDEAETIDRTAHALADGQAVGWFDGRMEFGPRALGARSILADPRSAGMQRTLNLKVKYRESFRPFAPSVLREDLSDWFELDVDSPYMLLVADVVERRRRVMTDQEQALFGVDKLNVPRSEIPAVTHVDYSARVQTDGLPGAGEHELQRSRRADRLYSRRRVPLLHGQRDRHARRRRLYSEEGRAAARAEDQLRLRAGPRLIPWLTELS